MIDAPTRSALQLVSLWIYPIKSCAGIEVASARVTPETGLEGDREWIIINDENQQVWMGGNHRMALVQPQFDGEELVLHADGFGEVRVSRQPSGAPAQGIIWNDIDKVNEAFDVQDAGDEAASWLSEVLQQSVRLVKLGSEGVHRKALIPLHVVSLSSLRQLNETLAAKGDAPVEHERFRPNLVIDHPDLDPFAEEGFSSLEWNKGQLVMEMTGGCIRCIMPNVNPEDATAGREPLATVTTLSRGRQQKNPIFGVYGRAQQEGILTAGGSGQGL